MYHFTNDDLEQFSKLKDLLGVDVNLLVTTQVVYEVNRNRDSKLNDALSKFTVPQINIPAFSKKYDDYSRFKNLYEELKSIYNSWYKTITEDIDEYKTPADLVISKMFDSVSIIPCDDDTLGRAKKRYDIGNPPGKNNSYGDAINWELLLESVPNGEDLYFISSDSDYISKLDKSKMNSFLLREWRDNKHSKIFFYKSLVEFLNEHIKEIKLEHEKNKEELIESLLFSRSFEMTHLAIEGLNHYSEWTEEQVSNLCHAYISNSQVNWIIEDADVFDFYYRLLNDYDYEDISDEYIKTMYQKIQELIDNGYPLNS